MKNRPHCRQRHYTLGCEPLESRRLMTVESAAFVEAPYDADDANVLMRHFGEHAEFSQGDLNHDGVVGFEDWGLLAGLFQNDSGHAFLQGERLHIFATPTDHEVSVRTNGGSLVVAWSDRIEAFEANVEEILFNGSDVADYFANDTDIPTRAWGAGGDDILIGGAGNDSLWGGYGNKDHLGQSGGGYLGADIGQVARLVDGGIHSLDENESDDVQQTVFDHDTLYGRGGDDLLWGGRGNDGLFGGGGVDQLWGGPDADRFLTHAEDSHEAVDLQQEDAVVKFRSGREERTFGMHWSPAQFTDIEVEQIDRALAAMHQRTGNTRLLKSSFGGDLTFIRQGSPEKSTISAWNAFGEEITLVDEAFRSDGWAAQVTFHEMAHNWDSPFENASIAEFRELSGWVGLTLNDSVDECHRRAGDSRWQFRCDAAFARSYARVSPLEDFAESFAAYFMEHTGREFLFGSGARVIPEKISYVDRFLDSLA